MRTGENWMQRSLACIGQCEIAVHVTRENGLYLHPCENLNMEFAQCGHSLSAAKQRHALHISQIPIPETDATLVQPNMLQQDAIPWINAARRETTAC